MRKAAKAAPGQGSSGAIGPCAAVLPLARGGMGRIDLVLRRDGEFERLYVRKRAVATHFDREDLRAIFYREARFAGLIRHVNVVSVLDVGEDESGPFLLMDFVEGVTLEDVIARGPAPMQIALRLIRDVAAGLHAAHEATDGHGAPLGLVHRDVSPSNILIGVDGTARIGDFGVASAAGMIGRTFTGSIRGKRGYLSPEQLQYRACDRRADLFALGVCLYEALTGQYLYPGDEGPSQILEAPPPDLRARCSAASPELAELVRELLAKNRDERPQTALEVVQRLESIVAELTEPPRSVGDFICRAFGEQLTALRRRVQIELRAIGSESPPWRGRGVSPILAAVVVWLGLAFAEIALPQKPAEPMELANIISMAWEPGSWGDEIVR